MKNKITPSQSEGGESAAVFQTMDNCNLSLIGTTAKIPFRAPGIAANATFNAFPVLIL